MGTFLTSVCKLLSAWRELLFPRYCVVCNQRLHLSEDVVCSSCLTSLPLTCYKAKSNNKMERLFYGQLSVVHANAYFYYLPGSLSRNILFAIKYNNRPDVGISLGEWMAHDLLETDFFKDVNAIVPVPLAKNRFRRRGYNQSEMLAQGVSRVTHLPVWNDVVTRVVDNRTQTNLNVVERRENVKGIFKCVAPNKVVGKHLLLIDDVVTTGSTLVSCASCLAQVPGVKFSVLTLAQAASFSSSLPNDECPTFNI